MALPASPGVADERGLTVQMHMIVGPVHPRKRHGMVAAMAGDAGLYVDVVAVKPLHRADHAAVRPNDLQTFADIVLVRHVRLHLFLNYPVNSFGRDIVPKALSSRPA